MSPKEYNSCVDLYADRVFRWVAKQLRHEANARDVVQNTFEILWRKREGVDFKKAKSYLFTVARNNMIDQLRKAKRIEHVDEFPEQVQKEEAINFELKDTLDLGLQQLNEIQRSVILLRDYEGYSYKEIAEITKLSISQVKTYIFRGRKKLQQYLKSVNLVNE